MTQDAKSILLICPDAALGDSVGAALGEMQNVTVERQSSSLKGLNGSAVRMAAAHDVVIFATDPADVEEVQAIAALSRGKDRPVLLALADSSISLSQARLLSKAGVDEVLPFPVSGGELSDQIAKHSKPFLPPALIPAGGRGGPGRVIAVGRARGGCGATTVAVNLADQLTRGHGMVRKQGRHSVALVDLDFQFGTVAEFLDIPPQDVMLTIAQEGIVPDAQYLDHAMTELPSGLKVLPAPGGFGPIDALRPEQVGAIVETLRAQNDYTIVDLPHVLVGWVEPVIELADELVLVTDLTLPAIRNCRRLIDFIKADHPALAIRVLVNREKRGLFGSALEREAAKTLELKLEDWLPDDPAAARGAIDHGKPVAEGGRSALCKAMAGLARRLEERHPAGQAAAAAAATR